MTPLLTGERRRHCVRHNGAGVHGTGRGRGEVGWEKEGDASTKEGEIEGDEDGEEEDLKMLLGGASSETRAEQQIHLGH